MADPGGLYDPKHVFDVRRACDCSKARAQEFLRLNDNDPQKALQYHQLLTEFVPPSALTPSRFSSSHLIFPSSLSASSMPSHDERRQIPSHTPPSKRNVEPLQPPKSHHNAHREPTTPGTPGTPASRTRSTESLHNSDTRDLQFPDTEYEEWDFLLPHTFDPLKLEPGDEFSPDDLVGAASHGSSIEMITQYLEYYDPKTVKQHINDTVNEFPLIFYVVARNDDSIVRTVVKHGANVCATHEPSGTPLLAFAIVHSETIQQDTATIVATLLSLGASPTLIPSALYTPYDKDLSEHGQAPETPERSSDTVRWCTKAVRGRLQITANLTQRYHLDRATKIKRPPVRHRQVTEWKKAEPMLGIPYFLVGQTLACSWLRQNLLTCHTDSRDYSSGVVRHSVYI
ncbi:hypothetical protein F4803DRAFT_572010 [Xylaria telfairii]|nr:hypothetical protein F4803DRAFT_572010 [Xylaria telfairii]